jgi:tRNA nucleotidyltransferase (CCA-adding enzyme)
MMKLKDFVDLVSDLQRRDLTINSIAVGPVEDPVNITMVDPFDGESDIKNKILCHTSEAFMDDPVRVLRIARFRARFGKDWTIANETKLLIHDMGKAGVLNELQPERIWKELSRALMEKHPRLFFDTLLECDVLHIVFPEVYALCSAMESHRWHPEGNAYEHTMLVLTQATRYEFGHDFGLLLRLSALVHDFGKGLTPKDKLPRHYGHDVNGVPVVEKFCNRLRIPTVMRDRVKKSTRYHMYMHKLDQLNSKTFVNMFMDMSSWNDETTVDLLYWTGIVDERGRLGSEYSDIDKLQLLPHIWNSVRSVKFADVFPNGETDVNKIKTGLFKARINSVTTAKSNFNK